MKRKPPAPALENCSRCPAFVDDAGATVSVGGFAVIPGRLAAQVTDGVWNAVVTMNSKVALLDLDTSERMEYVLAFPKDANIGNGSISVLAPIGTAILGYAKGDVVEWPVPSGTRRIRIEDILYQPEAAGDYAR